LFEGATPARTISRSDPALLGQLTALTETVRMERAQAAREQTRTVQPFGKLHVTDGFKALGRALVPVSQLGYKRVDGLWTRPGLGASRPWQMASRTELVIGATGDAELFKGLPNVDPSDPRTWRAGIDHLKGVIGGQARMRPVRVLAGVEAGFELMAASAALELRKEGHKVSYTAVVPFADEHARSADSRVRAWQDRALAKADSIHLLGPEDDRTAAVRSRERHIVDRSKTVLTANDRPDLNYAERQGSRTSNVMPELQGAFGASRSAPVQMERTVPMAERVVRIPMALSSPSAAPVAAVVRRAGPTAPAAASEIARMPAPAQLPNTPMPEASNRTGSRAALSDDMPPVDGKRYVKQWQVMAIPAYEVTHHPSLEAARAATEGDQYAKIKRDPTDSGMYSATVSNRSLATKTAKGLGAGATTYKTQREGLDVYEIRYKSPWVEATDQLLSKPHEIAEDSDRIKAEAAKLANNSSRVFTKVAGKWQQFASLEAAREAVSTPPEPVYRDKLIPSNVHILDATGKGAPRTFTLTSGTGARVMVTPGMGWTVQPRKRGSGATDHDGPLPPVGEAPSNDAFEQLRDRGVADQLSAARQIRIEESDRLMAQPATGHAPGAAGVNPLHQGQAATHPGAAQRQQQVSNLGHTIVGALPMRGLLFSGLGQTVLGAVGYQAFFGAPGIDAKERNQLAMEATLWGVATMDHRLGGAVLRSQVAHESTDRMYANLVGLGSGAVMGAVGSAIANRVVTRRFGSGAGALAGLAANTVGFAAGGIVQAFVAPVFARLREAGQRARHSSMDYGGAREAAEASESQFVQEDTAFIDVEFVDEDDNLFDVETDADLYSGIESVTDEDGEPLPFSFETGLETDRLAS
jgi:hypothetical protein